MKSYGGSPERLAILEEKTALAVGRAQSNRLREAAEILREVLLSNPGFVDALDALSVVYFRMERRIDALDIANKGLARRRDSEGFKKIFCRSLNGVNIKSPQQGLDHEMSSFIKDVSKNLVRAINEGWENTRELVRPACVFIKLDPSFESLARVIERNGEIADLCEKLFSDKSLRAALSLPLLNTALEADALPDAKLEAVMTVLRRCLLFLAVEGGWEKARDKAAQAFFRRLAILSFTNEFVFAESPEETEAADRLREETQAALTDGAHIAPERLLALAAYRPLHKLDGAAGILERKWPVNFSDLLKRQLSEPLEEMELRQTIKSLSDESAAESRAVRQQYEENPYPRWIKAKAKINPSPLNEYLSKIFPWFDSPPLPSSKELNVLVAGCGTGYHSTFTARTFSNAKVLAMDISKTSIAHAMRKTREMNISNIEYRFGDINKIGSVEQRFDLIESFGVLHHLEKPIEGWRSLAGLLKPGGYMAIGLYSEAARQDIVIARELIAERRAGPTPKDIRRFRHEVFGGLEEFSRLGSLLDSVDFYSLSGCRDLIFNAQEHRFTLPKIQDALKKLKLEFIGFENFVGNVKLNYQSAYPQDKFMTNLSFWHEFERKNPQTFSGMYRFWVRQPQ